MVGRRLFNSLAVASFLICVAVSVLWTRTTSKPWHLPIQFRHQAWEFGAYDGKVSIDNEPQVAMEHARADALLLEQTSRTDVSESELTDALMANVKLGEELEENEKALESVRPQSLNWTGVFDLYDESRFERLTQTFEQKKADWEASNRRLQELQSKNNHQLAKAAPIPKPGPVRSKSISMALVVLVLMVLPALAYRTNLIRRTRRRAGLCVDCGYDLRATPDRCPECGAPAARQ